MGDGISPKSIVSSGHGLFAAQNMMYRHTVTVYNSSGELLAKIPDKVNLAAHGFTQYKGESYLGGPVEACFSQKGKYLWVSNYNMIGDGFDNPGCDACNGKGYDPGFLYKINTETFQIEKVIAVGSVPKFLAISKDESKLLVSNWSSGDVSVIDLITEKEIKRVDVGAHPRGIAIASDNRFAYVTIMGSTRIAKLNLQNYEVTYLEGIGKSPRHVVLDQHDSLLYVSLNSSNAVLKYNLCNGTKQTCETNAGPRTMILSPDQGFLYVVNYFSNTFSKIRTDSMTVTEVVPTGHHPIGITANWTDSEIWVACYEGKLEIFKDFQLASQKAPEQFLFEEELKLFLSLFQPGAYKASANSGPSSEIPLPSDDEADQNTSEISINASPKGRINSLSKLNPEELRAQNEKNKSELPVKVVAETTGNSDCVYHVIVGSFSVPENAMKYQKTLLEKGYKAQLITSEKGLTYVSAMCFDNRAAADNSLGQIKSDLDVNGWILKN